MPNRRKPFRIKLFWPYKGVVWAILGPYFGYFCNIFASRWMKWLKFSLLSLSYQVEENHSVSNYWDHKGNIWAIRAIFWPYLQYLASICLKWLKFSLKSHACPLKNTLWCWLIGTILGPCLGHNRAIFWIFIKYLCF